MGLNARPKVMHGAADARFDPYSYVFFIGEPYNNIDHIELKQSFFKHRKNSPVIINWSGQSRSDTDGAKTHELCHWYQFGGTTLGANLTMVR